MGLARRATIAASVALATGCALVSSFDGFTGSAKKVVCGKRWPDPPDTPVGAAVDAGAVGAATAIRMAGSLGYNLDGVCSGPTGPYSCTSSQARSDLADGIDNAAQESQLTDDAKLLEALRDGLMGLVVRVENWNGAADRRKVRVSMFNAVRPAEAGAPRPGEAWTADFRSVIDPELRPRYVDSDAYVSSGTLVARFPTFQIRLGISLGYAPPGDGGLAQIPLLINLTDARLVGKAVRADGGLQMRGAQLVGRVADTDLLAVRGNLGACSDGGGYGSARTFMCERLDIRSTEATDDKRAPCDALSFAFGIEIEPAAMTTGMVDAPVVPDLCGDPTDAGCL